jgi:hypothetical protein
MRLPKNNFRAIKNIHKAERQMDLVYGPGRFHEDWRRCLWHIEDTWATLDERIGFQHEWFVARMTDAQVVGTVKAPSKRNAYYKAIVAYGEEVYVGQIFPFE